MAGVEVTEDHTVTGDRLPAVLVPDRGHANEGRARIGLQLLQLVDLNGRHVGQAQQCADLVGGQLDGDAAIDALQADAGLGGRDRRCQLGAEPLVDRAVCSSYICSAAVAPVSSTPVTLGLVAGRPAMSPA